jgi:hypothetical protein
MCFQAIFRVYLRIEPENHQHFTRIFHRSASEDRTTGQTDQDIAERLPLLR